MAEERISFGQWLPDMPVYENPGLVEAFNCVPKRLGYGPFPSLATLTGFTALAERARGGIAATDESGIGFNFAGTETKLYRLGSAGTEDVSKSGGYSLGDNDRWEFTQYADDIIATAPNQNPQFFNLRTSLLFDDLDAMAPQAHHQAIIGNQLFLGNLYDPLGDGRIPDAVHWSASDNPFGWPTPGSDAAAAVLSDQRKLRGAGGHIHALTGGNEVGAIFQERAIWRVDFVGGDVQHEIVRIEDEYGLLVPGLAIPHGRLVLYLHSDGFRDFTYTDTQAIGDERIDDFFLNDLDFGFLHRISHVTDPKRKIIAIAYPGADNTSGQPNRVLLYHWGVDKFALLNVDLEWLTQTLPQGVNLDTLPDPDLDLMTGSLDDLQTTGADRLMGAYSGAHVLQSFSGPSLAASWLTGHQELIAGQRAVTQGARPIVDGVSATVAFAATGKRNEKMTLGLAIAQTAVSGMCDQIVDGRYHQFRVAAPTGWDDAFGLEIVFDPAGMV